MQPKEKDLTYAQSLNMTEATAKCVRMMFLPVLRSHFGHAAFAWTGPVALLLLLTIGSAAHVPFILLTYVPFWVLAVCWRRLTDDKEQLSTYPGDPFLYCITRSYSVSRFLEMALLGGLGYYFHDWAKGMSFWLYSGAASCALVAWMEDAAEKTIRRQMNDAIKQQRIAADRWKGMR